MHLDGKDANGPPPAAAGPGARVQDGPLPAAAAGEDTNGPPPAAAVPEDFTGPALAAAGAGERYGHDLSDPWRRGSLFALPPRATPGVARFTGETSFPRV